MSERPKKLASLRSSASPGDRILPADRGLAFSSDIGDFTTRMIAAKVPPVVFVIDDDASVRTAISSLIRSVGLRVEVFASASEFLAAKRTDGPSCLILDVRLPGVSGLEFQAALADANSVIPIIFITGHGDIPMSVKAMKAGAVEFLTKPFRDQDLLDAVQVAIERTQSWHESENALSGLRQSSRTLRIARRKLWRG
jgi:FixJ family two-component response regulator